MGSVGAFRGRIWSEVMADLHPDRLVLMFHRSGAASHVSTQDVRGLSQRLDTAAARRTQRGRLDHLVLHVYVACVLGTEPDFQRPAGTGNGAPYKKVPTIARPARQRIGVWAAPGQWASRYRRRC